VRTSAGGDQDAVRSLDIDYAELLPQLFQLSAGTFYLQLAGEPDPDLVLRIVRDHSPEVGRSKMHRRSSGRVVILVDEAAEDVCADHLTAVVVNCRRRPGDRVRRLLIAGLVWAVVVVVSGVFGQNAVRVGRVDDQNVVEDFLRRVPITRSVCIGFRCFRCFRWALDDLDVLGVEDVIEAPGVFGVAVADEESQEITPSAAPRVPVTRRGAGSRLGGAGPGSPRPFRGRSSATAAV
jgi:hypothetical protein